jgi:NADPH2:quinone reductase
MLLYTVPPAAQDQAAADITRALAAGALTALPVIRFPLDQVAAAQQAVQDGAVGKVLVVP